MKRVTEEIGLPVVILSQCSPKHGGEHVGDKKIEREGQGAEVRNAVVSV